MAARAGAQLPCPYGILRSCTPKRKVQLPARAFQLLARPSKDVREYHVEVQQILHPRNAQVCQERKRGTRKYSMNEQRRRQVQDREGNTTTSNTVRSTNGVVKEDDAAAQKAEARDMFRKYMQRAVHPVAIVTSTDTSVDPDGGSQSWRGATVSSFNSVTLDPEPYVSFNIKKISSTYDAIRHSGLFTVHLMSHTPEAVTIATQFSRGNNARPFFRESSSTNIGSVLGLQSFILDRAIWRSRLNANLERYLPPLLQWREKGVQRAVLFQMLCEHQVSKSVEVGDHIIVVGKVIGTIGNLDDDVEREKYETQVPEHCLSYMNGRYSCPHASDRTQLQPKQGELRHTSAESP